MQDDFFPNRIIPAYTVYELESPSNKVWDSHNCRELNGRQICDYYSRNAKTLEHAVILGNNMILGKDGAVVVGLPYAWIGETFPTAFERIVGRQERRVGTIGKINFDFSGPRSSKPKLSVPKPQEYEKVADLQTMGGAVWGSDVSQFSTPQDPVRNQYTGTSISKGDILLLSLLYK